MKIFNTQGLQLVKKSLNVYTKQHEAIAQNIANANNDDYKRVSTDFSKMLKQDLERGLKTTHSQHISVSTTPEPKHFPGSKEKVDLSQEMGQLAENQIRYDFAARALARKYKGLSAAITGRNS